jgi:roadblock/LC7 domain-containing protein
LTAYEAQALILEDIRSHPPEAALHQLGCSLMTELLDVIGDTALEDFHVTISEALIGAFHSVAQRIERDADKARDQLGGLVRDFDGSEVLDTEIQEATRKARAADVATAAMEIVRDAAAAAYTTSTGEVWSPWKGSVKASRSTAAQIVAFRAAPQADTAEDASRIFDALNWARDQWPDMALATSGAKGAEKLAIKWAKQKGVTLVLAKADFDKHGRAAPFRANDEMLELDPVCVLTLANSINPNRAADLKPFGPALNLAQKAGERGLRHHPVKARA